MPSEIPVKLGSKSYKIQIAPGNLDTLGVRAASLGLVKKDLPQGDSPQKCLIVSNEKIFQLYGQRAVKSLSEAGFQVETCLVNEGEEYKNADSIDKIYHTASSANLERSSTMIALGGGVIGDMTGFAAATWVRGVNFIQVPTTLLAMVDASIGGKTGINYGERKNSIGAFYQPKLVLIDQEVLKTLIADEFQAGMAEVIKYGVIKDKYLFKQLEAHSHLDSLSCIPQELLTKIVERSCQAKAKVVSKDEREAGLRAILNYGHTIGHAIESLTNYTLSHGRAVGIGMVAAGAIAVRLGLWSEKALQRQNALIRKAGLGTLLPEGKDTDEDIEEIIRKLATDKKVKNGKVEFILPTKIGKVVITNQVPDAVIREVLREMRPI